MLVMRKGALSETLDLVLCCATQVTTTPLFVTEQTGGKSDFQFTRPRHLCEI